jgi:DNA processing protein
MTTFDPIQERLAVACLRPGPDTIACRELNDRASAGLDIRLEAMAAALKIDPSERGDRVQRARAQATRLREQATTLGVDLVTSVETEAGRYPPRLTEIADPPLALWRRGPAALDGRAVAIVGSRTATPAGLAVARQLSRDLATRGYTIVSGLAAGVDGAAHAAALAAGGATVAVLGCGVDVVYPPRHRDLARAVAERGCLVSEFPPGAEPIGWHFPLRNRIISGLSLAVVVVEASKKSGSLITARLAMDQGRDVLAVPGSVASGRYCGCHALIRDGARLVESVNDVIEELEGVTAPGVSGGAAGPHGVISALEGVMARAEPYTLDDLAVRTGRSGPELLADLGHLEMDGRISRTAGGCFVRA